MMKTNQVTSKSTKYKQSSPECSMEPVSLSQWLLQHVREDPEGLVSIDDLWEPNKENYPSKKHFSKTVSSLMSRLLPQATSISRRRDGNKYRRRFFKGVTLALQTSYSENKEQFSFSKLEQFLPKTVSLLATSTSDRKELCLKMKLSSQPGDSFKKIILTENSWGLEIRGQTIDLLQLHIDPTFHHTKQNLDCIIALVEDIRVCRGKTIKISELASENQISKLQHLGQVSKVFLQDGVDTLLFTSATCKTVLSSTCDAGVCKTCYTALRTFLIRERVQQPSTQHTESQGDEVEPELGEKDKEDLSIILEKVFKDAPPSMKILLQAQYDALKKKRHVRWDPEIITVCLSLWVRSPKGYEELRASHILTLPSGRQLRRYKNKVPQKPGINQDMLRWMHRAAKDQNLTPDGWHGGLVHDETKLQQDLVLDKTGRRLTLVGWVDTGEEGNIARVLREGKVQQSLATEVLQIMFLGYTGFRFPICHFPTNGVKATELHSLLPEVIRALQHWGFTVDYIVQDGGEENRHYVRSCFAGNPADSSYMITNPCNYTRDIALVQDFSHNIKKIRNSLLKSGTGPTASRLITMNGKEIHWNHWVEAVKWDRRTNSRPMHQVIRDEHLFPKPAEKMRNHLAEEMLDKEALKLMVAYKETLHDKSILDGTISLLAHTSKLINIFRDHTPIKTMDDTRVKDVRDEFHWFQTWRRSVEPHQLFTKECCDDLESMLLTFPLICDMHLKDFAQGSVVPSRFNSDCVENFFCQERGLHNGTLTNPSYYTYASTVNSVILGQTMLSKGRKSNAGLATAQPFSFYSLPAHKKFKMD